MKFKIRFADQIVGIFVLLAIVGVAVILIFIGINQRWFAKNYYFTSKFPSGEGLSVGMPVYLQGFKIGEISKISLTEENEVDIVFFVEDTYYSKVLPDSVLELVSSLIGLGTTLKFHPGKTKWSAPLPEYSLIPALNTPEGKKLLEEGKVSMPSEEDVINSVIDKINPILDEARGTLAQLKKLSSDVDLAINGKGGPMGDMVNGLAQAPAKLNNTIDNMNSTINTINDRVNTISNNFTGLTDKAKATIASIDPVTQDLKDVSNNLKLMTDELKDTRGLVTRLIDPQGSISTILNDNNALFNQVNDAIRKVNEIIGQIESFVAYLNTTKPEISTLLEKGSSTLDEGKDVLEAAKNNPLLKGGVPEQKAQGTTLKSYRDEDF
jgi:phospholipid/cholesterol/gamma-HCH transport system substrate-binding protein